MSTQRMVVLAFTPEEMAQLRHLLLRALNTLEPCKWPPLAIRLDRCLAREERLAAGSASETEDFKDTDPDTHYVNYHKT